MGSRWRKVKLALGLNNTCLYLPRTLDDSDDSSPTAEDGYAALSAAASASGVSEIRGSATATPKTTSTGLLIKNGSISSKKTCIICLGTMKPGHGHALFTAECSHTFHFHCIVSNVKHGNSICPVCRAKWKEIPFQASPTSDLPPGRPSRVNPVNWPTEEGQMATLRRIPRSNSSGRQNLVLNLFHISEPTSFNDDEPLDVQPEPSKHNEQECATKTVDINTYTEFSVVQRSTSQDHFSILINLKASVTCSSQIPGRSTIATMQASQASRVAMDLVTVLDVSGSMAGTKLALLKRAMGFVIQNLGPSDRLSVVAFSSTARRLFHLRRMTESGRQQALQAINSLLCSGGTNIAEGLKKGAKILDERNQQNPVCSIILLSDGQDTYTLSSSSSLGVPHLRTDYSSLLPSSLCSTTGHHTPVHSFGFGTDHDSASMHSISETSGGTFSFIETEGVIQDAFAQCIGGLLSVVVQEVHVCVETVDHSVRICSIKAGSYASEVIEDGIKGSVDLGDLYADEERDFLVSVNIPSATSQATGEDTVLLRVNCEYKDPVSKETVHINQKVVSIQRPEVVVSVIPSIEVDCHKNRFRATEAMAKARTLAERGVFSEAVSVLNNCRQTLAESPSAQSGDRLCAALDAEMKEMQERMASRQQYEASGRAYVLSGLSSHSWQRATARGDSTDAHSLVQSYQTPTMVDMVQRSQTMVFPTDGGHRRPPIRPTRSIKHRSSSSR